MMNSVDVGAGMFGHELRSPINIEIPKLDQIARDERGRPISAIHKRMATAPHIARVSMTQRTAPKNTGRPMTQGGALSTKYRVETTEMGSNYATNLLH